MDDSGRISMKHPKEKNVDDHDHEEKMVQVKISVYSVVLLHFFVCILIQTIQEKSNINMYIMYL